MLFLHEIVPAGITSVVGVLGVDTTLKTISGLLARVNACGAGARSLDVDGWLQTYCQEDTRLKSLRELVGG